MAKLNLSFLAYQAGAAARWFSPMVCPACGERGSAAVDRKGMHRLRDCDRCHLLYRHPREADLTLFSFYQHEYAEPGLTTDLPTDAELKELLANEFRGSVKDFSPQVGLLQALGATAGSTVLDYGANWGYAVHQYRRAGFAAEGYEISGPRATFAKRLGVHVHQALDELPSPFDFVISCHVLEHVNNPKAVLDEQLGVLKPGGFLIAYTPNGSLAHQRRDPATYHKIWGRVHPVLLTERFLHWVFPTGPLHLSCTDELDLFTAWSRADRVTSRCDGFELVAVHRKAS